MTLDGVPLDQLGIGAGWAIVALFVIAILRGNLIPRRTYDDIVHDRDEWRAAQRISESARVEGEIQRNHMAETANTMNQLMRELQDRLRPGGNRNEEARP